SRPAGWADRPRSAAPTAGSGSARRPAPPTSPPRPATSPSPGRPPTSPLGRRTARSPSASRSAARPRSPGPTARSPSEFRPAPRHTSTCGPTTARSAASWTAPPNPVRTSSGRRSARERPTATSPSDEPRERTDNDMTTIQIQEPAIQVQGLEKSYQDLHVLRGVDFEVERGGIFALLGSNGAGKT